MFLRVVGSSSSGNSYLLESENQTLMIECGRRFEEIKKALKFDLHRVQGCLLTHLHGDHSKAINQVLAAGIDVYSSSDCFDGLTVKHHRAKAINPGVKIKVGDFSVKAFEVKHDVTCYGYMIDHPESGLIGFITDTFYVPARIRGLKHIIVEANYSEQIIKEGQEAGRLPKFLKDRILESHFSLENCKDFLLANDLSQVQTITLIHLSNANSNEEQFKREIEQATGKRVFVANAGMNIELNKSPF